MANINPIMPIMPPMDALPICQGKEPGLGLGAGTGAGDVADDLAGAEAGTGTETGAEVVPAPCARAGLDVSLMFPSVFCAK